MSMMIARARHERCSGCNQPEWAGPCLCGALVAVMETADLGKATIPPDDAGWIGR
jgi:hypothetical protein